MSNSHPPTNGEFVLIMAAVAAISFGFGLLVGLNSSQDGLMQEAYERGYAETYMDGGTPAIRWKEPAEKKASE